MTVTARRLFLAELARSGNLAFALYAAGVSYRDAIAERDENPPFERDWRRAGDQARRSLLEALATRRSA